MIIIGVDFHPEFQEIASVDTDTGGYREKRLTHPEEAAQLYRSLASVGQTSDLLRFLGTLQLSIDVVLLRTIVRLDAQPAVGPELSFAAEAVRSLHQREQACGPSRSRCRESGAAVSRLYVSGSPPITPAARFV
jgi:hypothetical protein